MTLAMFKLESFRSAQGTASTEAALAKEAVEQAYATGLADGLARKEDELQRNLSAGLDRLSRALRDDEARRAELRQEAVNALAPILGAIVDSMAPASASQRLEAALRDELARLAQMAIPLRARIDCGPELRSMAERCLIGAGLDGIELTDSDDNRIILSLQGGRIEFSPEQIAQDIRALVSELKEDDRTWTH